MMRDVEPLKPLVLTVPDACRVLRIGKTKLYALIGTGELKTLRIGRKRLIEPASLQALIDAASTT